MHASRDIEQPDNSIFEKEKDSELPSRLRTGSVIALDLASSSPPDSFNPGWRFYTSFISLCIITLAVALDATSLSVALPVIDNNPFLPSIRFLYRRGTFETYRLFWKGTQTRLTHISRSFLNLYTAAPSPPFGAGHPSSYPPLSSSPPSLRFLIYLAVNLFSSSHSSSSL